MYVSSEGLFAVVLGAYIDDSTDSTNELVVAGGFLSHSWAWEEFEKEWAATIKPWGIDYFHMTDFLTGHGEYETWTFAEKLGRMNELLAIINRWTLLSFGVALKRSDFKQAISMRARSRIGGRPFSLAAMLCFQVVARELSTILHSADGNVAYFVECGTKGDGAIKDAFDRNQDDSAIRLHSLEFVKKTTPGAQAADIIAGELMRDWQGRERGAENRRFPFGVLRLTPHSWHYYRRSEIEEVSQATEAAMGTQKRKGY